MAPYLESAVDSSSPSLMLWTSDEEDGENKIDKKYRHQLRYVKIFMSKCYE